MLKQDNKIPKMNNRFNNKIIKIIKQKYIH